MDVTDKTTVFLSARFNSGFQSHFNTKEILMCLYEIAIWKELKNDMVVNEGGVGIRVEEKQKRNCRRPRIASIYPRDAQKHRWSSRVLDLSILQN